jgi:hypothetical protein
MLFLKAEIRLKSNKHIVVCLNQNKPRLLAQNGTGGTDDANDLILYLYYKHWNINMTDSVIGMSEHTKICHMWWIKLIISFVENI